MISDEEKKEFIKYGDLEDLEGIKKIINKDNVNCIIEYTETPLAYMLFTNKIEILEYLLNIGANPNHIYYSLLSASIENTMQEYNEGRESPPDIERLKLLIKYGADINFIDNDGYTPLNTAISSYFGHYEAEDYLRSLGAKTKAELEGSLIPDENYLLFRKYCYNLDLEGLKSMGNISNYVNISYYVDPVHGSNIYKTPLLSLIRDVERYKDKRLTKERLEVFEYLLKNGADPNITKDNRLLMQLLPPLLDENHATKLNVERAIKLYVEYGGNINADYDKMVTHYDTNPSNYLYYKYTFLDKLLLNRNESSEEAIFLRSLGAKTAKELEEENK